MLIFIFLNFAQSEWLNGCNSAWIEDRICDKNCMTEVSNYDKGDCNKDCKPPCSVQMLTNNACDSQCLKYECGFDVGMCSSNNCAVGCKYSQLGDGVYDEACDNSDCLYDLGDTITVKSEIFYVKSGVSGIGTGTLLDPFGNIQEALKNLKYKITQIYLQSSQHYLYNDSDNSASTIEKKAYGQVIIQPKYCEGSDTNCVAVGTKPVIYLTNDKVKFILYGKLTIKNVRIEHFYSFSDCGGCEYCRYIEEDLGLIYSDQGEELSLGEYADVNECYNYNDFDLFSVKSDGELQLENVQFYNMRMQYRSIIFMSGGITNLVNVDFYNIVTDADGAAIYCDDSEDDIFFSYDTGTVSLINNGYEVEDSQELGGFMHLVNINEISLKNLVFEYNIVNSDQINLVEIKSVNILVVQDCKFEFNFIEYGGLINVDQEDLFIDDPYINILNINISGCTFKNNSVIAAFNLKYKDNCQKISFHDNIYEYNYIETLINVENKNSLQSSCYEGDSAMYLNLGNEQFNYNLYKNLVYLKNQANIIITNATFTGTSQSISLESTTFNSIKLLNDAYLTITPTVHTLTTESLIFLSECISFTVYSIQANSISSTLIKLSNVESITLTSLTVSNSNILDGELFTLEFIGKIDITDINLSNVDLQSSQNLLYLKGPESQSTVTIESFIIDSSKGGIQLDSASSASITSLKISNAMVSNQALLSADFSLTGLFILQDSEFEYNYSPILDLKSNQNSSVLVSISDILVQNCISSNSLIKLDESLTVISESSVKDSIFKHNSGLPLEVSSSNERVSINSCTFTNNINSLLTAGIKAIGSSTVIITDCNFTENIGSYIIYILLTSSASYVQTSNCKFSKNLGVSVYISESIFKDFFSNFTENTYLYAPVLQCYKCDVYLNNTFIYLNIAEEYGCVYINWKSNFYADSVIFKENSAASKGGGLFVEQESVLTISNCTFQSNSAQMGSAIFIQHNTNNNSAIYDTIFNYNDAYFYGAVTLLDATVLLNNCQFYKNSGPKFPAIAVMFNSVIYIENSQFLAHLGEGAHMSVQSQSSASVVGTSFMDGYSELGASSLNIYDSELNCTKCTFKNDNSDSRSCIDCLQSTCEFYNTMFEDIDSGTNGQVIFSEGTGKILISGCQFNGIIGTSVHCGRTSTASIENSEFTDGSSYTGAGVYCNECIGLEIIGSTFQNMQGESSGGCITLASNEPDSVLSISNSYFTKCKSMTGGAISLADSALKITNSVFINNQATSESIDSEGGSIYIYITEQDYEVSITSSNFSYNSADVSGGAIQWYGKQPTLENNLYSNNRAVYGPDFASYSCKLSFSADRALQEVQIAPGQEFKSSIVSYVLDHYNQVVTNDFDSSASITVDDSELYSVTGTYSGISSEGIINITGFYVYGKPGTIANFSLSPSFTSTTSVSQALNIEFTLRSCIAGEVEVFDRACTECSIGTYNLKPGSDCLSCPTGAVCYGGSKIVAASGYWRASKTSDKFYECPNPSACLEEKVDSNEDHCASGYEGNCCQSCADGYSRTSSNECTACMDEDKNTGLLIGLILIAIIILVSITVSTLNGAYKEETITSIYFKIIMNYFQLVGLTISFDLGWPWFVKEMFQIQGKATGGSEQLISVDCFLQGEIEPYYAKLVILALIPFLCFIFSGIFWAVWGKIKKSENLKAKLIGSMIVQLFFFQPTLVKYNFSMFNCTELAPGQYFMTEDMSISCWKSDHLTYTLSVALPSLIIWCISVPALLVILLFKNRAKLDNISEKLMFGFLYKGFKKEIFYWEFIILLKEVLIICCSVFLKNISIPIQALVVFVIIFTSFILQQKLQPYTFVQLNQMEIRSIAVSAVTIYAGMFFLTGDLSEGGKILLFVMMVLANTIFFFYWIYFTFGYYIAKVYLKVRCCKKLFNNKLDTWAIKVVPDALNNKTETELDIPPVPANSSTSIFSKRSKKYSLNTTLGLS